MWVLRRLGSRISTRVVRIQRILSELTRAVETARAGAERLAVENRRTGSSIEPVAGGRTGEHTKEIGSSGGGQ
jgi:broad specificity phosphatase PhoE